jgi:hypothetical protein
VLSLSLSFGFSVAPHMDVGVPKTWSVPTKKKRKHGQPPSVGAVSETMCFMGESATTGSLPHTVYASARDKLESPVDKKAPMRLLD